MPTVTTTYPVVDDREVTLSVTIGDAQAGGSSVFLGSTEKANGNPIPPTSLGLGSEVRGQTVVVSTTVVDVRPEHDHTSVTVTLAGGLPPEFPIHQAENTQPGGAVSYLTVVRLV